MFKSITVDAWVAWHQLQREDMLPTRESFKSLEQYRISLNKVESLAHFVSEINPKILAYAKSLEKDDDVDEIKLAPLRMSKLKKTEITRLISKAQSRKRYRLRFFNSPHGVALRVNLKRHDHDSMPEAKYHALCGNNTKTQFRGHRTRIQCKQCNVHLRIKSWKPFKRSCWGVWHSVKRLKPRKHHGVAAEPVDNDDGGEVEVEGGMLRVNETAANNSLPPNARSRKRVREMSGSLNEPRRCSKRLATRQTE